MFWEIHTRISFCPPPRMEPGTFLAFYADATRTSQEMAVEQAKADALKKAAKEGGKLLKKAAESDTTKKVVIEPSKKAAKWLAKYLTRKGGELSKKGAIKLAQWGKKGTKFALFTADVAAQIVRVINYMRDDEKTDADVAAYSASMWAAVLGNKRQARTERLATLRATLAANFNLADTLEAEPESEAADVDAQIDDTPQQKQNSSALAITRTLFNKAAARVSKADKPRDVFVVKAFQRLLDLTDTYDVSGWMIPVLVQEYFSNRSLEIPDARVRAWLTADPAQTKAMAIGDSYLSIFHEIDAAYAYDDQPIVFRNAHASLQTLAQQHGTFVLSHPMQMVPLLHKQTSAALKDNTSPLSRVGEFTPAVLDALVMRVVQRDVDHMNAQGEEFVRQMERHSYVLDLQPMNSETFLLPTGMDFFFAGDAST